MTKKRLGHRERNSMRRTRICGQYKFVQIRQAKYHPWFYMPTSVYEILKLCFEFIRHVALSRGMMSEEALEDRNKSLRKFGLNDIRNNSRRTTMDGRLSSMK